MIGLLDKKMVKMICFYCGVGCGVLVIVRDDGLVVIVGDLDYLVNYGCLCFKGLVFGEILFFDDWVFYFEINGQQVDWDIVLDFVVDKFLDVICDYGLDSVVFYVFGQILMEDYYVVNKLMKGFIGLVNIDINFCFCMVFFVVGYWCVFGVDMVLGIYEDLEICDFFVLVGFNFVWCYFVFF